MKKSMLLVTVLTLVLVVAASAVAQEMAEGDFSVTPMEETYRPYDPNQELIALTGVLLPENQCGAGYYVIDEVTSASYFVGAYDEYLLPGPDAGILAGYDGQRVTVYGTMSENNACVPYMTVYWVEPTV